MSKYDDYLAILDSEYVTLQDEKKKFKESSKDWILKLYEALKEEKELTKDDRRERLKQDCLKYWSSDTFNKFLPDELKDPQKVEAGKKGREKQLEEQQKQKTVITTDGQPFTQNEDDSARKNRADNDSDSENKEFSDSSEKREDINDGDNRLTQITYDQIQLLKQEIQTLKMTNSHLETANKSIDDFYKKRIEQLESRLSDHAFEMINKTKNDVRNGIYHLDISSQTTIILNWQYFLTTDRMIITVDQDASRRLLTKNGRM